MCMGGVLDIQSLSIIHECLHVFFFSQFEKLREGTIGPGAITILEGPVKRVNAHTCSNRFA